MHSPPQLFLSGFFGFGNIGDEALLVAAIRGLRDLHPGARFRVLSGDPNLLHGDPGTQTVDWRDTVAILDAIAASDAVIFLGGLLHDGHDPRSDPLFFPGTGGLALHAGAALYAGWAARKSIFLAVGAGPLRGDAGRKMTERVCNAASLLTVRDAVSENALREAGVDPARIQVGADLVFAYPPEPEVSVRLRDEYFRGDSRRPRLGVALRSWPTDSGALAWEREVAQALDQWLTETGGSVVFLPMQTGSGDEDDRAVAERILAMIQTAGSAEAVTLSLTPEEMRGALGACDGVLGMRYHAIAFAALGGIPFVSLSYDPKVRALVAQLGLEDLDQPLETVRTDALVLALRTIRGKAPAIREQLLSACAQLRLFSLRLFPQVSAALGEQTLHALPDALLAETFRQHAQLPMEQAARIAEQRQERNAILAKQAEDARLHLAHTAQLEAQLAATESDFRALHTWSQAQGEHVQTLISELREAQEALAARRFPSLSEEGIRNFVRSFRDSIQIKKRVHAALDLAQKLTPAPVRRSVRPAYLSVYRRLFPLGPREFGDGGPPVAAARRLRGVELEPRPASSLSSTLPGVPHLSEPLPLAARPLVSVVLPVWNQPDLLAAGIRSILDQSYRNLELIVVDDGSTADLVPVLSEFQTDARFRCVRRPHEGLPRTLSAGFRIARGQFWTWTSADNFAHPEMLETLLGFLLRRPDLDMTFGNMDLIDDRGAPLHHSDYRVHAQRPGATHQLDLPRTVETLPLINDNFIGACFLYRAEMGRALGAYDPSLLGTEDYDYWLRMQSAGTIEHVDSDACLYSYRVHDNSLSGQHAQRIGSNAELLIERNRKRSARWSGRYTIFVSVTDARPEVIRTARALVAEWTARGHRVASTVDAPVDNAERVFAVQFGASPTGAAPRYFTFAWHAGRDAAPIPAADWYLLPSPDLADTLPADAAQRWSVIPLVSAVADADLQLLRKARDNHYPLWDAAQFARPLLVYAGPIHAELDWRFLARIAQAQPPRSLLFFSTDEQRQEDPHAFLPASAQIIHLGYKRPREWVAYLSQADVLLASFGSGTVPDPDVATLLTMSLEAAKPVLATRAGAASGFDLAAPFVVLSSPEEVQENLTRVLEMEIDVAVADRYLAANTAPGLANRLVKIAQAQLEAPCAERTQFLSERNGPRILLETQSFDRGGLERVVLDMARFLHLDGFPVSVAVAGASGKMADECRTLGVPVYEVGSDPAAFRAVLDRERPDILVPHYSTFGAEHAWRRGIPVLGVIHNSYIWADGILEAEIRQADLFVTSYIAVSRSASAYFSRRFGVGREKIRVVANGVDVERCRLGLEKPAAITRAHLGLAPRDIVLLMAGSLIGTKAQLHAVAALERILERHAAVHLLIVGPAYDAAYAALLKRKIAEFHLETRVRIVPETEDIFDFYRLADAFLCTSLTEGWSLAMTEAMFCGLPILTTDVGGASEVIENEDIGILMPPAYKDVLDLDSSNLWSYAAQTEPRNLDQLAAGLERFCEDVPGWRHKAAAGKQKVLDQFSTAAMARRYRQEIDRLLIEHYGGDVRWRRDGTAIDIPPMMEARANHHGL